MCVSVSLEIDDNVIKHTKKVNQLSEDKKENDFMLLHVAKADLQMNFWTCGLKLTSAGGGVQLRTNFLRQDRCKWFFCSLFVTKLDYKNEEKEKKMRWWRL